MPHVQRVTSVLLVTRNQQPSSSNSNTDQTDLLETFIQMSESEREQRFASTYDLARTLKLTRHTIQNWINDGSIAAVRIGKKYQIDLRSVEIFLRRRAAQE